MFLCEVCNKSFTRKSTLNRHYSSELHRRSLNNDIKKYTCPCGKNYSYSQSLHVHKQSCAFFNQTSRVELLQTEKEVMKEQLDAYEKEREEMKAQIASLMDKYAGGNTTNNTTNIENQTNNNNIHIHINAFGQENIDYLDDKAIIACIDRVYKSIPALIEKIHFDPEHPENHNIKITNKKLPYASVMGDNSKWKMVDKKDAIETMVFNGYNLLDEKYPDNKQELSSKKREHFENFKDKFQDEDKELLKQVKTDVELLVLNSSQ